jgi:hypothetical protein
MFPMFYSICVESMYFVSTHLVLYLLLSHHLSSFIVYHHLAKTRASSRADLITYKRQESEVSHRVLLRGCFFFFLRIFLRPGIMFVSLFVCMFVCLSHFLSGAVGGRGLYIITLLVPFKRCGVCS